MRPYGYFEEPADIYEHGHTGRNTAPMGELGERILDRYGASRFNWAYWNSYAGHFGLLDGFVICIFHHVKRCPFLFTMIPLFVIGYLTQSCAASLASTANFQ